MPVLGTQPPLPGAAAVRYVDVATSDLSQRQDLVPVGSYYEEEYDYQGHYSDEMHDDPRELCTLVKDHPEDHLEDHLWEGDISLLPLGRDLVLSVGQRIIGPENVQMTSQA